MKSADAANIREKMTKIGALAVGGSTLGERSAAQAALDRAKANLPIQITATVLNIDATETFYEVFYTDVEGKKRKTRIAKELFASPGEIVKILTRAFADLPDDKAAAGNLVKQAIEFKTDRAHRVTSRCGWHQQSFVYPTKTFGDMSGQLAYEGAGGIDPALGMEGGSVAEWREGLREPCRRSDFLILTISTMAASPLLDIVGEEEGVIFHLQGTNRNKSHTSQERTKSSSGKTLGARVGASMTGRSRKNDLITFAATERSVEEYCWAHNHLGVVFDEEGRALGTGKGPRIRSDQLPYLVPSGRGALRSKRAAQDPDLANLTWALNAVSTGEHPLDDLKKRPERPEGAQVRMISVSVPSGKNGGIFNRVEGSSSEIAQQCKKLACQVEDTIAANYGVAMPAYLHHLVAKRSEVSKRLPALVDQFVKRVGADTDPWERRFAKKFGLNLAAAILLAEFGVAPWTTNRARSAITRLYRRARLGIVSVDQVTESLVERLLRIIDAGKRFPLVQKGELLSANRASKAWGCTQELPRHGRVLKIPYSRLKSLLTPPMMIVAVMRKLAERKVLIPASDGKSTRQTMIKALNAKKRQRFVCLVIEKMRT